MPAAEVRDDVSQRVVEDVAHVQVAGGVRKHLEHVELLAAWQARRIVRVGDVERALALPHLLPLRLDRLWVVGIHFAFRQQKSLSSERPWEAAAAPPRSLPGLQKKLLH
jgi:hypothetical protein